MAWNQPWWEFLHQKIGKHYKSPPILTDIGYVMFTLIDDSEGFTTSVEEITADVMEIERELELEVEPEDVAELLQSHGKIWLDKELLLVDEQRKWSLEMESTSGKDAVKIVEMTTKDLEWYINSVDKARVGFQRSNSNSERNSTMG